MGFEFLSFVILIVTGGSDKIIASSSAFHIFVYLRVPGVFLDRGPSSGKSFGSLLKGTNRFPGPYMQGTNRFSKPFRGVISCRTTVQNHYWRA